jgi:hypothetical protein
MCTNENDNNENQLQFKYHKGHNLVVNEISKMVKIRNIQVGKTAKLKIEGISSDTDDNNDGGDTSALIIAMLDVIHKGIINNAANEAAFADVEGIDALLDLLETSDFLQRIKVLRVLADLFENARIVPYAHAWRSSRTMRPSVQLITHCWIDEEARLCVSRDEGVLCNIFDALGDHAWPEGELGPYQDAESASSTSAMNSNYLDMGRMTSKVEEMSATIAAARKGGSIPTKVRSGALEQDTRGILAAIMQLMGLLDTDGPSIAPVFEEQINIDSDALPIESEHHITEPESNNNFALINDDMSEARSSVQSSVDLSVKLVSASEVVLDPSDKQVIALARRYDIIRLGEWWRHVQEDLTADDIEVIEADHYLLEYNLRNSFDAALSVQLEQMKLLSQSKLNSIQENNNFVNSILDQKAQQIKAEYLKRKAKHNASTQIPGNKPRVTTAKSNI